MNARELRDKRAGLITSATALVNKAETENRDLNEEEQRAYDGFLKEAETIEKRYTRIETLGEQVEAEAPTQRSAPNLNFKTKPGDSEIKALANFMRTGDTGAVRSLLAENLDGEEKRSGRQVVELRMPKPAEIRAVTDSTMNITTAADGLDIVPTGFAGKVAMRRSEIRLAEKLGVQMVPGKGTTVNFPFEAADAQDMATTTEQSDAHDQNYGRDALRAGLKPFTLVKKTKKLELTEELLEDEDVNLMAWIADNVGRAIAFAHNAALVAEVAATGTLLNTFASATAIAVGEPDAIVFNDTLASYLDDGGSVSWVMRPTTFGAIKALAGDPRVYGLAQSQGRSLLEYPVEYSAKVAAIAASAKTVLFGNWYYMGLYESPSLRMIVDPYSVDGIVVLKYSFRLCYGQLIAGAIGYGAQHAPAG